MFLFFSFTKQKRRDIRASFREKEKKITLPLGSLDGTRRCTSLRNDVWETLCCLNRVVFVSTRFHSARGNLSLERESDLTEINLSKVESFLR